MSGEWRKYPPLRFAATPSLKYVQLIIFCRGGCMWIALRITGFTRVKTFAYIGLAFYLTISSATISADPSSTCWVYGGLRSGQNSQLVYGLNELDSKSWPDATTALQALEDFTASRLLGIGCYVLNRPFDTTISRIDKGPVRISQVTSGRVGDPQTGVTIGYSQTFAGFNQLGDYCSVHVELEILDGTYYGWPQCRQNYSIKLSPLSTTAESGTILTSIEPDKSTASLVAKVYDSNGQLVPNTKVKLELSIVANSGGHQHNVNRPKGTLSNGTMTGETIAGNTETNGFVFTFKAPAPAGDHKITASCTDGKNCTPQGPDTVWVGLKAWSRLFRPRIQPPGHCMS